jgi:phage shock protein A
MLLRQSSVESRMRVKRQNHKEALDDAFDKFERFERRVDSLEGQLESMDIGMQPKADLKSQIDALAEDDGINDELARLKEKMTKTN